MVLVVNIKNLSLTLDRFIWWYWVNCARYTLQNGKNAGSPKKHRGYLVRCLMNYLI